MNSKHPYWYSRVSKGLLKDTGEEYFMWCNYKRGTITTVEPSLVVDKKYVLKNSENRYNITEEQAILLAIKKNGDFLNEMQTM